MKDGKTLLNLTFREINLLNLFLNNNLLTISELEAKSSLSPRTIEADFVQINKILFASGHDVKIVNQRGKGYLLDYPLTESEWLEILKQNCSEYLNQSFSYKFGDNLRIARICRFLCSHQGYTKMDQIARKLNFSVATINKDMRTVRTFFAKYDLQISSVPYYGMKLVGKIGAIRSCLVDLLDVYDFVSEETLFPEYALVEYGLKKSDLLIIEQRLQKILSAENFPLTDMGFKAVTKYLATYKLRDDGVPKLTAQVNQELTHTKAFTVAKRIIKNNLGEQLYLAIYLLVNTEISQLPDLKILQTWSRVVNAQMDQVLLLMQTQLSLHLSKHLPIIKYIRNTFFIKYLKKKYQFVSFNITEAKAQIAHKLLATVSLAIALYNFCPNYSRSELDDSLFNEFVLGLYNIICREENEYFPTSFLVVNDDGKLSSERLIRKLNLNNYNVSYRLVYSYELANIDCTKYDYLLISNTNGKKFNNFPIPQITFSFFLSDQFRITLWQQLLTTKRKLGSIMNYLKEPMIIELTVSNSNFLQVVINNLIAQLSIPEKYQAVFHNYLTALIANEDIDNLSFNMYLTLLGSHHVRERYLIFKFRHPVLVHGRKVSNLQVVVLDLSKGLLEIKNGDSELRRYFNVSENV